MIARRVKNGNNITRMAAAAPLAHVHAMGHHFESLLYGQ